MAMLRPGAISRTSAGMFSFCSTAATYFAAAASLPGGLVVLMRIRSVSQPCASVSSCVRSLGAAALRPEWPLAVRDARQARQSQPSTQRQQQSKSAQHFCSLSFRLRLPRACRPPAEISASRSTRPRKTMVTRARLAERLRFCVKCDTIEHPGVSWQHRRSRGDARRRTVMRFLAALRHGLPFALSGFPGVALAAQGPAQPAPPAQQARCLAQPSANAAAELQRLP